jgi:hypothetical protein
MKKTTILAVLLMFTACSQPETQQSAPVAETLSSKVEVLLDTDSYTEALDVLAREEDTPEVLKLREKVYLNYGLFLEYRDNEVTNMRDKMNNALRQYVEVLKINPDNEKAITEVEQILGIYSTFPNRQPDEDVMAELKELGFKF